MIPNLTPQATRTGYAQVNGLKMYYEMHGEARPGAVPLVMLHGALSATDSSFGMILPHLARQRQVISIEQQAHGRTADIDRPLTIDQMAEDTVAALRQLQIRQADILGYSMGSAIAMQIAMRYPELVRKLVVISPTFDRSGFHPGVLEGIDFLTPEIMIGSPFEEEYRRLAPRTEDFATLVNKVKQMDLNIKEWTAEDVRSIQAPTLIIIGDSDIVRPEHAVELFRLLGGGVAGDNVGLPKSQLAILPGATHITVVLQPEMLLAIIPRFLDGKTQDASEMMNNASA